MQTIKSPQQCPQNCFPLEKRPKSSGDMESVLSHFFGSGNIQFSGTFSDPMGQPQPYSRLHIGTQILVWVPHCDHIYLPGREGTKFFCTFPVKTRFAHFCTSFPKEYRSRLWVLFELTVSFLNKLIES